MHEKVMSYDEFSTLYPDKLACYRFLEKLKEQHGFTCTKCGNTKFSEGAQKFARRCTRCGYNESVTANTIFHAIKFPITKAFYIVYLTYTNKKSFTLDAMSHTLDLRLNTIWAFRQKVSDRIAVGEARKLSGDSWEGIVLDLNPPTNKAKKPHSNHILKLN